MTEVMGWIELALWYAGVFLAPAIWGLAIKQSERGITVDDDEVRLNRKRVKGGTYWTEKVWKINGKAIATRQKLLNILAQAKCSDPSAVVDVIDTLDDIIDETNSMALMKDPDDE